MLQAIFMGKSKSGSDSQQDETDPDGRNCGYIRSDGCFRLLGGLRQHKQRKIEDGKNDASDRDTISHLSKGMKWDFRKKEPGKEICGTGRHRGGEQKNGH